MVNPPICRRRTAFTSNLHLWALEGPAEILRSGKNSVLGSRSITPEVGFSEQGECSGSLDLGKFPRRPPHPQNKSSIIIRHKKQRTGTPCPKKLLRPGAKRSTNVALVEHHLAAQPLLPLVRSFARMTRRFGGTGRGGKGHSVFTCVRSGSQRCQLGAGVRREPSPDRVIQEGAPHGALRYLRCPARGRARRPAFGKCRSVNWRDCARQAQRNNEQTTQAACPIVPPSPSR